MAPRRTASAHPAFRIKCPACGSDPGVCCSGGSSTLPWIHTARIEALPVCTTCEGVGRLAPASPLPVGGEGLPLENVAAIRDAWKARLAQASAHLACVLAEQDGAREKAAAWLDADGARYPGRPGPPRLLTDQELADIRERHTDTSIEHPASYVNESYEDRALLLGHIEATSPPLPVGEGAEARAAAAIREALDGAYEGSAPWHEVTAERLAVAALAAAGSGEGAVLAELRAFVDYECSQAIQQHGVGITSESLAVVLAEIDRLAAAAGSTPTEPSAKQMLDDATCWASDSTPTGDGDE